METFLFFWGRGLIASADHSNGIERTVVGFAPIALFLLVLYFLWRRQFHSPSPQAEQQPTASWRGVILITIAFALIVLAIFFRGSSDASSSTDKEQVVAAIRSMYMAAMTDDLDKWHAVAAPDFYAFDNGKKFEGDALMDLIKKLHAAGRIYRWHVTEPDVHVAGTVAWITYLNRGSVQDASGTKNATWLESATLHRQEDGWRIQFFHSTRVPE